MFITHFEKKEKKKREKKEKKKHAIEFVVFAKKYCFWGVLFANNFRYLFYFIFSCVVYSFSILMFRNYKNLELGRESQCGGVLVIFDKKRNRIIKKKRKKCESKKKTIIRKNVWNFLNNFL